MRGIPFAHTYDSPLAAGGACFKLGGSGGGGSSSAATTNQEDKRQAIGESGIILGEGATFNFENPDGFAALLGAGAGVFEAALEFTVRTNEGALLRVDKAIEAVAAAGRSEETNIGLQVLKIAGPIILIGGIAAAAMYASK